MIASIRTKRQLVDKLLITAYFHGIGSSGGPGYHIKKLSHPDREIVKQLTSKDFNDRIK